MSKGYKVFLTKLNWQANSGELKGIIKFQVDVYEFVFEQALEGTTLSKFIEYARSLDMTELRSIMRMWIWLYQHEIKFKMHFAWNESLSVRYNLKNFHNPGKLNKRLLACGHDDLMSYSGKEGESK